jgi:hypothetical protein
MAAYRQYQPLADSLAITPELTLDWLPTYPVVLRRLARPPLGAVAGLGVPIPDVVTVALDWLPGYPAALRRLRRAPGSTFELGPLQDFAPLLVWEPVYPDRLLRARTARLGFLAGLGSPIPDVVVSAIDWLPAFPDALRRLRRAPGSTFELGPLQDFAPLLSWEPVFPDRLLRARTASLGFLAGLGDPIPDVALTALNWFSVYPDVLRRARRPADFPSFFFDFLPDYAPLLGWEPAFPDLLRRARSNRQMDSAFFTLTPAAFPAAPALSWSPVYPSRMRSAALGRLWLPFGAVEPILPIPTPPGAGIVLTWRQQKSWYRSSS